jgi:hypothetical protein
MTAVMTTSGVAVCLDVGVIVYERSIWELMFALQYAYVGRVFMYIQYML